MCGICWFRGFAGSCERQHDNKLSRLSLSLCEKFGDDHSVTVVVHLLHYYFYHHLRDPIQSAIDPLMNADTLGMRIGSVHPVFSCLHYCPALITSHAKYLLE